MMLLVMKRHDLFADIGLEGIVWVWQVWESVLLSMRRKGIVKLLSAFKMVILMVRAIEA